MARKGILLGWLKIIFGLFIFSLSVHLTILADLGLAPWDCLDMGISRQTPLNYGLSMTVMGVCIRIIDLLMKEKISFGMAVDALLTGNSVQLHYDPDPFPKTEHIETIVLLQKLNS